MDVVSILYGYMVLYGCFCMDAVHGRLYMDAACWILWMLLIDACFLGYYGSCAVLLWMLYGCTTDAYRCVL
jgi:hypothetical protein